MRARNSLVTILVVVVTAILTACGSSSSSNTVTMTPPAPRTVTVNWVNTYWTPTGTVQQAAIPAASLGVSALVPQSDGSLTVLEGSTTAPGVITIPNVPAGYYWLTFGSINLLNPLFSSAYWTNTSTFDAGRDVPGSPVPVLSSPIITTFAFNLSGLNPATPTSVEFNAPQAFPLVLYDFGGSPTLSTTFGFDSNIDWSQVNTVFLTQYVPATLGSLNNQVLGPEATLSNLSLTDGATNPITATLTNSPQASLNLDVLGSQWVALFNNASPSPASPSSSALSIYAEPYVTSGNALGLGLNSNLTLASTTPGNGIGFGLTALGNCDATGFPPLSVVPSQPAIVSDTNFGALQCGDPFSSSWVRALSFCEEATVPIAIPNSTATANFALVNRETVAPSAAPLAPVVSPVQNPTINGASFFTASALNTSTPMITWSAPASGAAPYGYKVSAFVQATLLTGLATYQPTAAYNTAQTSITLPRLSGGNTYVFAITAEVDGTANIQTAPFRSSLPTGTATVVSAPVTISSGAATPAIHGDAKR